MLAGSDYYIEHMSGFKIYYVTVNFDWLDCIALCSIVFFNVLRWIVLQSDGEEPEALHCIALHCIGLDYIVLHCVLLLCVLLHCVLLNCVLLHCVLLQCVLLHCVLDCPSE